MARKKRQVVYSDKADDETQERGLTLKRQAFVELFTNGKTAGNAVQSAIGAGYSRKTSGSIACELLRQPKIQNAIDAKLRAEMSGNLTVSAVRLIDAILKDKHAPLKIRADCAQKVIEYSGIVSRIKIEKANETGLNMISDGPKRLGEMTRQELENVCRDGALILQAAAALPAPGKALDASETAQKPSDKRQSLMVSVA